MNRTIKFAVLALGLSSMAAAQAQQALYVGASVSRFDLSINGLSNAKPSAFSLKLGEQMNPNFAAEVRLGKGMSGDSISGADVKVNSYYGFYAKGILPVTNEFSAYGLLGYTRGKVTVNRPGNSASDTDGGLSYGLGVDYMITKNASVGLEWARLFKGSVGGLDYKVNGLALGVAYKY
jgi:opacity protein-like surface antigen